MHVKGMELPMHEPRAKKGLGLSYATSNRGGCHLQSFHDTDFEANNVAPEIGISKAIDRHDTSRRKVKIITKTQDWMAVINSLILCTSGPFWFGPNFARPEPVTEMFNTVTSWDLNVNDLMTVGERINNLCRCFNAREGVTRLDDDLPLRFKKDPLPNGLSKGQCLTQKELENMLDDYYTIRGWNLNTGIPTRQKLKKLNLEFADIS